MCVEIICLSLIHINWQFALTFCSSFSTTNKHYSIPASSLLLKAVCLLPTVEAMANGEDYDLIFMFCSHIFQRILVLALRKSCACVEFYFIKKLFFFVRL